MSQPPENNQDVPFHLRYEGYQPNSSQPSYNPDLYAQEIPLYRQSESFQPQALHPKAFQPESSQREATPPQSSQQPTSTSTTRPITPVPAPAMTAQQGKDYILSRYYDEIQWCSPIGQAMVIRVMESDIERNKEEFSRLVNGNRDRGRFRIFACQMMHQFYP